MSEKECSCEALPKVIQSELADLDRLRKFTMDHVQAARDVEEIAKAFSSDPVLNWAEDYHIHAGFACQIGQLRGALIIVRVRDLRHIVPVLRELRRRGYKIKEHEDDKMLNCRTYLLEGDIYVRVFLPREEEAGICRFVQVGVKEEPIYEIKCRDEVPKIEEEVEA